MEQNNPFYEELNRYRPYLSSEKFSALLNDANYEAPLAVRINRLKHDFPSQILKALAEKYAWETKQIPFSTDALQVLTAETSPSQTIEHKLGHFYIQDAASILPVTLFNPADTPLLVLDMAASPGGKTTQLIDDGHDRHLVIANDSASSRIPALRTVLQTWGANNFAITNFPGEKWGVWYPETFDRILLDAPCSMQSLRVSANHPHRPITEDERGRLASRQLALIISAAKALKTGGELVYSTCTLSPEEDEAVISALFDIFPDSFEIDAAKAEQYKAHGMTAFEDQSFHPQLLNSLRIWPFIFQTNGFFAAKLTKIKATIQTTEVKPNPPVRPVNVNELSENTRQILADYFQENFGYSLGDLLDEKQLGLYWWGEKIWLQPKAFFNNFAGLQVQLTGIPLGQFIRRTFEPSIDLFLAYGEKFNNGFWLLPEEEKLSWMKGYDIRGINLPGLATGSFLQIRDAEGNNLGAGKYSKERLRNLLPNRHLIR